MKDKDQKFTVISNKKVIKRFAAVIDSNDSNFNEQIKDSKKEIIEENPLILSKDKLVSEKNIILEKQETIKKSEAEEIKEPAVVKKINKKLNNNIFKLISDDYYYNKEPSTLEISHLTKIIKKRVILKDVSVTVNPQEIVALLGPNGAGKTTLFSVVLGILNPTQGKVIFNNKVINELPIHMRAKEGISYLPQARSIFRGLTVEENIRAVAEVAIKDEEKQDELVEHLLNEFKIAHLRTASALSLSGGEARRVEIARCLTTSPKVLLLDEPFAALDPIAIIELKEMLRHLKDKGISIFITDHNVKETLDIVDRAYIINNGELIAEGSPQEIVENKKARQLYLGSQFRI
ncbi:YhbG ABC-type (unclassified) transport system, ATPase component [Candidatus Pelagibacterales bacterium]|jgi:lipopolysaccharide export system ATP-binding protein